MPLIPSVEGERMRTIELSIGDRLMIGACMPRDGPAPDMGLSGGMPLTQFAACYAAHVLIHHRKLVKRCTGRVVGGVNGRHRRGE